MSTTQDPGSLRRSLAALGVVFGDIGTSPLYAFRESFIGPRALPVDAPSVLGVLSLIIWALILVVTVKYVLVTMRADNRGEGGSFALLALIRRVAPRARALPLLTVLALLGTALLFGDAVITPAISILSAVEGLQLADPRLAPLVLPATIAIAVGLFAVQSRGTAAVARFFAPVMLLWFLAIAVLGLGQVVQRPGVLLALSPHHAAGFVTADPLRALFTLGTVVLTVTGAEALYADMGHFGRRPIARAWMALVLPALLLCYAGQAALVLNDPAAMEQAFYLLAPGWALWPLLALATAATVIASQAAITGAFSVAAQAVQLGYLPRLRLLHTAADARGQVYLPAVNALLCAAVVAVCLAFPSSTQLAGAFGFAVAATMLMTTALMGFVIFRIWRWNPLWAVPLYAVLLGADAALFAAASTKLLDGAWLPLLIGAAFLLVFDTWSRGRALLAARRAAEGMALDAFLRATARVPRVQGQAVYLTREPGQAPRALLHSLKHHQVLHAQVLLLEVRTSLLPSVPQERRVALEERGAGFAVATVTFGFMEAPRLPPALEALPPSWRPDPMATTYVLGRDTLVPAARPAMARWRMALFAALLRQSDHASGHFGLPAGRVVEIGAQVAL